MAPGPSLQDLQLTSLSSRRDADGDELEDVRLLDSYDEEMGLRVSSESADLGVKKVQLKVTGMTCSACTNSVESAVKALDGVVSASVSLLQNRAYVVFDPAFRKVCLTITLDYSNLKVPLGNYVLFCVISCTLFENSECNFNRIMLYK
jgi:copper chaperone CopZ